MYTFMYVHMSIQYIQYMPHVLYTLYLLYLHVYTLYTVHTVCTVYAVCTCIYSIYSTCSIYYRYGIYRINSIHIYIAYTANIVYTVYTVSTIYCVCMPISMPLICWMVFLVSSSIQDAEARSFWAKYFPVRSSQVVSFAKSGSSVFSWGRGLVLCLLRGTGHF